MNDATTAELRSEAAETVKVSIEVVYTIDDKLSLLDAMAAAKALLDNGNVQGSATGEIVMGRKRFPLR